MRGFLTAFCTLCLIVLLAACGGDESTQETSTSQPDSSSFPSNVQARAGQVREVTPKPVPSLTLETLEGNSIELAQQDGRVLVINFWATWCPPCREEIPDLKTLHSDLRSKGLTVIGVALDRQGREVVEPYVQEQAINYPIVIDAEETVEAEFGPIRGLPTTVVVNPDGQITKRVYGRFPTEQMESTLREMIAAGSSDSGTA